MIRNYFIISSLLLLFAGNSLFAQNTVHYAQHFGPAGFNIESQDQSGIQLTFSVHDFTLGDAVINGKKCKTIGLPGVFLPANEGAPNLPGTGRYLAIPNGAGVELEVVEISTELIQDLEVGPAPRIPKETEDGLEYPVNELIYSTNAFYPAQPVSLSEPTSIRGVNAVMIGITPFQYNPVTKELRVIKDIRVKISFQGGNNAYGDTRLRSRWFDPLLQDLLLNPGVLPKVDYNKNITNTEDEGCEYLIIVPNDTYFTQWADTIKKFRTRQGIITEIKTLAEVGGNTTAAIEGYLNNAFNTWNIPPVACLLIGDYGTNAANTIISPIWDSYCVSDNIYGDVTGNSMPDIVMARMTAQNAAQLEVMVRKFIDYERNPPTNPGFYNHPITALGWQTERWFQICSEVIKGFWQNSLGKDPVRVNAIYSGNPSVDPWSTNQNTQMVLDFFGPNGLSYIPATPQSLGGWSGGTAAQVNAAINEGAFMLQHRDHGDVDGWGEPAYYNSDINGLTNTDLCFIMSVNCLTGKYNNSSEVFAEKFHRYTYNGQPSGALGILAASEVSYSFVNDAFIWGVYDNMWPEFMPTYGSTPAERGILPAFGNAAGKYFLEQSSWPYNTNNKEVTYNLFHHHGDAFLTVYSEVPQALAVTHDPTIFTGVTALNVTANAGALICLSMNGEILGTATANGTPVSIVIPGTQLPPDHIDVVVTLQNYTRYEGQVQVIPPVGPYVVKNNILVDDQAGNNNGLVDYGETIELTVEVKNVGVLQASNVMVTITSADPYVNIITGTANYGDIQPNGTSSVPNAFIFTVADNLPDYHLLSFSVAATDGSDTWMSYFSLTGHAPVINYLSYTLSDPAGNNNGKLDPGETAQLNLTIKNTGSADASNVSGLLSTSSPFVTVNTTTQSYGSLNAGASGLASFSVTADAATPAGQTAAFTLDLSADLGITGSGAFTTVIGQVPILIIDVDPDHSSGSVMNTVIQGLGLSADYQTAFPPDLSLYSSIFVCLGIYSNNHTLNSTQGQALASYLNQGGRLYMEGGDTWAYDDQTAVHPLFKINGTNDGSGDLGTLNGQAGTFTAGMGFSYSGGNSYIDRIDVLGGSTAFKIFQNQSPSYGSGVAYDGGTYRTIGTSHEFGGLNNGSPPSTKAALMTEYLTFFGIIAEGLSANFSAQATTTCTGASLQFNDLSTGNPTAWLWDFPGGNPATSTSQNPVVTYANTGTYAVTLTVYTSSDTVTLTKNNYLQVISAPAQAIMPTGPLSLCNNTPFTNLTTVAIPGATSYSWSLSPAAAGVISGSTTTGTIYWNLTYNGPVSVAVNAVNTCGSGPLSPPFSLTMNAIPTVSLQNFSNVCVNWPAFALSGGNPGGGIFSGSGVLNGYFHPDQALLGNNNIIYTYTDSNLCSGTASKNLFVDACTGLTGQQNNSFRLSLYPNPAKDVLNVNVQGITGNALTIRLHNAIGQLVHERQLPAREQEMTLEINTSGLPAGVYYLSLETAANSLRAKCLIE